MNRSGKSHPNTIARLARAVEFLRKLQGLGGRGEMGAMHNEPSWPWAREMGFVASNRKQWWITPHGKFTLECWSK